MPLPLGAWSVTVHGEHVTFKIDSIDPQGVFSGAFGSNAELPIVGFWDEVSQTITFTVKPQNNSIFTAVGVFSGNLFRVPFSPEPGQDVTATLAGTLQVTPGSLDIPGLPEHGTARRNSFGWFAQIREVV